MANFRLGSYSLATICAVVLLVSEYYLLNTYNPTIVLCPTLPGTLKRVMWYFEEGGEVL